MSSVAGQYEVAGGHSIQVRRGDLTQEDAEAIVNAANTHLAHGGGVAGAIVRRGGEEIQSESTRWVAEHGRVPTGQVAVTGAGSLRARYVIHAVGPVWHGGEQGEEQLLRSAVSNSLQKAHEMGLASIALPAISSGIFGFSKTLCAEILLQAAVDFYHAHPETSLKEIRFTNNDDVTVAIFLRELERMKGKGKSELPSHE